jgi:N-dimethylarginine dimethylaminohydrolase
MKIIKPTYVSFEQAKLLKEKGFDVPVIHYYCIESKDLHFSCVEIKSPDDYLNNWNEAGWKVGFDNNWVESYSAPEQWQVVEWFFKKHGLFIQVLCETYNDGYCFLWQIHNIKNSNNSSMWYGDNSEYDTPEKAYYAAFNYILKLI